MLKVLPDLPPIVDSILDALLAEEEVPTLSSCTLVCKQWLLPSTLRLFHTIRIVEIAGELTEFIQCLDSSNRSHTICESIRQLSIASSTSYGGIPSVASVCLIISQLPNLSVLFLRGIPLAQWLPDSNPTRVKLKRLYIHSYVSQPGGDLEKALRDSLAICERVSELHIGSIGLPEGVVDYAPSFVPSYLLPVESLVIDEPRVLPALRNILCPDTIRSLSVRLGRFASLTAQGPQVIPYTSLFLERFGSNLRHLDIQPVQFNVPGQPKSGIRHIYSREVIALIWPWDQLSVSHCTSLESLVLYVSIATRSRPYMLQPYSWKPLLVLQNISAPLRKIRIHFQIIGDREDILKTLPTSIDWARFDELLLRYDSTLEGVDFELAYERLSLLQLQRERRVIQQKLSRLQSLGVLRFV